MPLALKMISSPLKAGQETCPVLSKISLICFLYSFIFLFYKKLSRQSLTSFAVVILIRQLAEKNLLRMPGTELYLANARLKQVQRSFVVEFIPMKIGTPQDNRKCEARISVFLAKLR